MMNEQAIACLQCPVARALSDEKDALAARLAAVERILNDYWQGVGPTDIVPALRKLFPVPAITDRSTSPAPACPNVGCTIKGPHEHEITGPWDATANSASEVQK